jgi:hypothetical protein
MKQLIQQRLTNTPALQSKVARRIYAASSLGQNSVPADPKKPFIVYREVDTIATNVAKDTSPSSCRRVFQFYVHDVRGTYKRINSIISVLRETVVVLTGEQSPSGARCSDAVWNGTSGETEDPTYDSNLRIATFTLVSSE